jgi:hypothetical protein
MENKKKGLIEKKREKDGAKMELRRNGTINIPFLLSSKNWLEKKTSKREGTFRFYSSKMRGKNTKA